MYVTAIARQQQTILSLSLHLSLSLSFPISLSFFVNVVDDVVVFVGVGVRGVKCVCVSRV